VLKCILVLYMFYDCFSIMLSTVRGFDLVQLAALLICTTELVFISVYYNDHGIPTGMYVSDILFEILPYKILMSIFVAFQALFSFCFALRLYTHMKCYFICMTVSVVVCLCGWATLNVEYLTEEGATSDVHKYGTVFFMIGCVAYSALLLIMIRHKLLKILHCGVEGILGLCVFFLMLLCVVFGAIFLNALMNGSTDAWIYEHTSFMTLVLAHIFFFCLETPNPWTPIVLTNGGGGVDVSLVEPEKERLLGETRITVKDAVQRANGVARV
jgi:hypothetical protein